MKKRILIVTVTLMGILFSGCSNQELMMAQSAVRGASLTPSTASIFNASLNQVGAAQGQLIGYSMLANPVALGMMATVGAISKQNAEDNKKSYAKMNKMMENQDISNDMVKAYNKKYGTHYKNMKELQNSQKI